MKKLVAAVALSVAAGCVPGNSPIHVTEITTLGEDCSFKDPIARGSLDIGGAGSYLVHFLIKNEMDAPSLKDSMGKELDVDDGNAWVATEIALTYTSKDPVITFEQERFSATLFIPPNGNSADLFPVNIIGPKAAQKLRDNVTDPAADPKTTVTVKVEIRGHSQAGTSMPANAVYVPLVVYTTGASCPNGVLPSGPCSKNGIGSAGQDGSAIICCAAGMTGPGCF